MMENTNFYIRKFKLTDEQVVIYKWLKESRLNVDDGTLCYWSKKYPSLRIREVVKFAQARITSGQVIQNIGGWIHNFLKSGNAVVNDTSNFNREYAIEFSKHNSWKDLKIYEKYVKDSVTEDDLPLTIATDDFKDALERLYRKSQLYK
jgi:hypothetical protein